MRRIRNWWNYLTGGVQPDLFGSEDIASPQTQSVRPPKPAKKTAQTVRTVVLGQQIVPYRLERARRKTVGMMIDTQGLRVRAASHVSVMEVERILQSKASWILRHLNSPASGHTRNGTRVSFMPDLFVADGDSLKLLGREVRMVWGAVQQLPDWHSLEPILTVQRPRTRSSASDASMRLNHENAVANAAGACLLAYLHQRAQWYSAHFGVRYRDIVLSNAKTLWGTCRRDGLIRMNWRLAFLDEALIDYVLAHELAHTIHMNHSAAFWAQVERMCPDYRALRRRLKQFDLRGA